MKVIGFIGSPRKGPACEREDVPPILKAPGSSLLDANGEEARGYGHD